MKWAVKLLLQCNIYDHYSGMNKINFLCQNGVEEVFLFDPQLLEDLPFEDQKCATYKPEISPTRPGDGLTLRPLCVSDFDKGNHFQGIP